jgi:hypothetical protein
MESEKSIMYILYTLSQMVGILRTRGRTGEDRVPGERYPVQRAYRIHRVAGAAYRHMYN